MGPEALRRSCLAFGKPDHSGVLFLVNAIPRTLSSAVGLYMQGQDGRPLWVLDHSVVHTGTVVPQTLWSPQGVNDIRQHVAEIFLQMPIFFTNVNGAVGLSLSDGTNGRYQTLSDGCKEAQLGGRVTTHIRILVCSPFSLVSLGPVFDNPWVHISGQVTSISSDKSRSETRWSRETPSVLGSLPIKLVAPSRPSFG